jgi:hypothetical protein
MFIPTTAQNLHTKVYTNTASILLISAFSVIFGEVFNKEKHNTGQYYIFFVKYLPEDGKNRPKN